MQKPYALKFVGALLATSFVLNTTAEAQMVPTYNGSAAPRYQTLPSPTPSPSSTPSTSPMMNSSAPVVDPGVVMLDSLPPPGGTPRAASAGNVQRDTPVMSRAEFLRRYPNAGIETYNRIVAANRDLCDQGYMITDQLTQSDQREAQLQVEFDAITQIYQSLPGDVRRGTAVMTIAQAASTGALCLLSGGWYCIAAVVVGIANIFQSQLNKKLQLANIRLSMAILRQARETANMSRTWIRMGALWVDMAMRYCRTYMPQMQGGVSMNGSFSSSLPQLDINGNSVIAPSTSRTGNW